MAIAEAHLGAVYNRATHRSSTTYTYCICGDGDLMEGISSGSDLARRPPQARQADRSLRRQPRLARRSDRRRLHRRRRRAFRSERLAHAASRRRPRQRRRDDRSSDHRGEERHRSPVVHRGAHAHRLTARRAKTTTAAHGEPLGAGERQERRKKSFGWPLEPDFLRSRRRARVLSRGAARRARSCEAQWKRPTTRGKRPTPISPRSSSAHCAASFRRICRGRRSPRRTAASRRAMPAAR